MKKINQQENVEVHISPKNNRHYIEKEYKREVSPTEFTTENAALVREYLEPTLGGRTY